MSEIGDTADLYRSQPVRDAHAAANQGTGPKRTVQASTASAGWGRGPAAVDSRKFKFDLLRAKSQAPLGFFASKVDRLDAEIAGEKLQAVLAAFGIMTEDESRIYAFMNALFFQHTLNGGSILQPGRGKIAVDGVEFDLAAVNVVLGVDARRFYRAFADEIAEVNQRVLDNVDPMDPESMEMHGQLMQVAHERGLQKYPKFAHDSADACVNMTLEERRAVISSKRIVLLGTVNRADAIQSSEDSIMDRQAQAT